MDLNMLTNNVSLLYNKFNFFFIRRKIRFIILAEIFLTVWRNERDLHIQACAENYIIKHITSLELLKMHFNLLQRRK